METKDILPGAPTFTVYNDATLAAWANNDPGNDYSHVQIVKNTGSADGSCTFDCPKSGGSTADPVVAIDLTVTGTRRVTGDTDSKIKINFPNGNCVAGIKGFVTDTYPKLGNPPIVSSICGVTVVCTSSRFETFCFYRCANLINCNGEGNCINPGNGNVGIGRGFYYCTNLINCIGTGTGTVTTTGNNAYGAGFGFENCANLVNCTGVGSGTGSSPGTDIGCGYGFYSCRNLTNCTGTGTAVGSTIEGYGFYSCRSMTLNRPGSESTLGTYYNCYVGYSTSSGSPADTATGGWNSDTVIIAEKEEAEREHAPQHVPLQVMV